MIADAMLADTYCACSGALAEALRGYPDKVLARITGAEPATVKGWKSGKWPTGRALVALVAHFGPAFLDAAFAPVCAADAPLARRIDRVDADIQVLKREIADAERLAARLGDRAGVDCGTRGEVGTLARGLAAARRGTAAALAVMCLWSGLTADPDDDEWIRTRPPVARVLRIARAGRKGEA